MVVRELVVRPGMGRVDVGQEGGLPGLTAVKALFVRAAELMRRVK